MNQIIKLLQTDSVFDSFAQNNVAFETTALRDYVDTAPLRRLKENTFTNGLLRVLANVKRSR